MARWNPVKDSITSSLLRAAQENLSFPSVEGVLEQRVSGVDGSSFIINLLMSNNTHRYFTVKITENI